MRKIQFNHIRYYFNSLLKIGVTVLISVLIVYGIVQAGSLAPLVSPAATSYTLSDIYTRLTTNATSTEADHIFTLGTAPAGSLYTLTQIYSAIPTIDATKILSGTSYLGVAGTLANNGAFSLTPSPSDQAVAAGYYSASTLTGDADLISGNIRNGINIFGVAGNVVVYSYGDNTPAFVLGTATGAGTALKDIWNGTGTAATGGSQLDGGVDDFNLPSGTPATSRYASTWTQCTVGNSYCGTSDSKAAYKDDSTGLIWSKTMNGATYALDDSDGVPTWFGANNCEEVIGAVCTKKTSSKTGCESHAGWSLPHQKQLLQGYIDGAYGNLDEVGGTFAYYWSATTNSDVTDSAWHVALDNGHTAPDDKAATNYVRCVR